MSSERLDNQKKRNQMLGTGLIVAAVLMGGYGYKLFRDRPQAMIVDFHSEVENRCKRSVQSFGLQHEIYGRHIALKASEREHNSKDILAWSSMIIQQCEGYRVKKYCIGDGCGDEYFTMVLEYRGSSEKGDS